LQTSAPLSILSLLACAAHAAPCGSWQAGSGTDGIGGINSNVNAVTSWDSDGTGPQPAVAAFGGLFSSAGGRPANSIAAWDGSRWLQIGSGFDNSVFDVVGLPNGELLAVGNFLRSGTTPVRYVAKWNGQTWQDLGGDVNGLVFGAVSLPDGAFAVSGYFSRIGGINAQQVAIYQNSSWHPMGSGLAGQVFDLTRASDGTIYASGLVSVPGENQIAALAAWNGFAWSRVENPGLESSAVPVAISSGGILVGGYRNVDQGNGSIASFIAAASLSDSGWSTNGNLPTIQGSIDSLAASPTRSFAAGFVRPPFTSGVFSLDQASAGPIPGGPNRVVASMIDVQNRLVVAGRFTSTTTASGNLRRANRAMIYDGTRWSTCSEGLDGTVAAIHPVTANSALLGGNFRTFGGVITGGVARWTDGVIQPVASPLDRDVLTLSTTSSGIILAGLASETGATGSHLLQLNNSSWSDFGPPLDDSVRAILPLSNGEVIAAGEFLNAGSTAVNRVARLSNGHWQSYSTGTNGPVYALTQLPNGTLVAGGFFSTAGTSNASNIAYWNNRWWPLDTGLGGRVNALVTMPDGTIIAGGAFTANGAYTRTLSRIARWVNNSWEPVGAGFNGNVNALYRRGNRLIATGEFTSSGTTSLNRIAEWDGLAWRPLGTGLTSAGSPGPSSTVSAAALVILPNSDVLVGGAFESAGGLTSDALAWWHTCLAEFNCDGVTDFFDYLDFVQALSDSDPRADINSDGTIDLFDYLDFVSRFSDGC